MKNRTVVALFVLFFAGLTALWVAELRKVPSSEKQAILEARVLPDLYDIPAPEIHRVEIVGGETDLVLERRGEGWWMRRPVDAAADAGRAEALVQSLKNLPRPVEGKALEGPPSEYGLEPPSRTIRVFGKDSREPLAVLEVGKSIRDGLYVRSGKGGQVEVVDPLPFAAVEKPASAWRDRDLFRIPTFQVSGLKAEGSGRTLAVRREGDRWRLTAPIEAPAMTPRIEGLIGGLTSMRVIDDPAGFAADDVKDFAPFGLDAPAWVITLSGSPKSSPVVIHIGKPAPGRPGTYYARRADDASVLIVEGGVVPELEDDPHAFRSRRAAELNPARVDFIRIQAGGVTHELARGPGGWRIRQPIEGQADVAAIADLVNELNRVEATALLEEKEVSNSGLAKPEAVLEVWEGGLSDKKAGEDSKEAASGPEGEPALRLTLGRRNGVARVVYARADGDPAILALPLDALKRPFGDRLAFLDHQILRQSAPAREITLSRGAQTIALAASEAPRDYAKWRMVRPVEAAVDPQTVKLLDALMENLRAERLVEQGTPDKRAYGLDEPWVVLTRSSVPARPGGREAESVLVVGSEVPDGGGSRYAMVEGQNVVFTIGPETLKVLDSEPRERRVLEFPPNRVERLVLRSPGLDREFRREAKALSGQSAWTPVAGTDMRGLDQSRLDQLVSALSTLRANRFAQYLGEFPPEAGLDAPRLSIEVELKGGLGSRRLRIGSRTADGLAYATTESEGSGPLFLVPDTGAEPWSALLPGPARATPASPELPENPFVSEPDGKAK
jgi:hypothetical protein